MKKEIRTMLWTLSLFALTTTAAHASGAAASLTDIANNITAIFPSFINLVVAVCYVAGMGFAAAGVMKFKQHKDNPTQVPLSGPVVMIFIAAALIYLPTLLTATGTSVFGTSEKSAVGGVSGQDPFKTGS